MFSPRFLQTYFVKTSLEFMKEQIHTVLTKNLRRAYLCNYLSPCQSTLQKE